MSTGVNRVHDLIILLNATLSRNLSQLPVEISGKRFQGQLTGDVVGIVTGSLVGTASSSVRSALAYGLTATPDITVGDITATTLTGNVVGDITGTAGYAHTAGLGTYAFVAGLSTDSQRSVYSQLAGVSTVSGYATTAGIATLAVNSQGLTGSPDIVVGLASGTFKGDGSQLSGIDASALKFGAATKVQATNTGAVVSGILTATSFSGDGSSLSNLPAGAPVGGASTNTVFFENDKAVAVNYQVTSTKNAMSAGPIAINAGIAVTVPSGCSWTIV